MSGTLHRLRSNAALGADIDYLPRLDRGNDCENMGDKWAQASKAVVNSNEDNHANPHAPHVLLVPKILIRSQEHIKLISGQTQ